MRLGQFYFFISSRRRHTRWPRDWSSDVCSSDLTFVLGVQGTSQAAPHVSGLAALLVEKYGRDPGAIKNAIQTGADQIVPGGTSPGYGKGRINVPNSLGL